ncbi:MAG TPA: oxygenase MpaB family protein [Vicinamibacterales bacterium]
MTKDGPRLVGPSEFEQALAELHAATLDPQAGLFGPQSMLWRVDQDAAIFLGAGRALLLQLAHPWVAAAITDHSRSLTDPFGRFHRTFRIVFTIVFGTRDQALAAARRLYRLHTTITGTVPARSGRFAAGSAYHANEEEALRWVHATLIETAILARAIVRPPLTSAELERYWQDGRRFAALFGIRDETLPPDWAGFMAYNRAMWASDTLVVTPEARAIADALWSGAGTWLRVPRWYRRLTAHMLPSSLRAPFGFAPADYDEARAARITTWVRGAYPWIPSRLRLVGPYQEARGRLAGRAEPAWMVRRLNRFWIGQPAMPAPR